MNKQKEESLNLSTEELILTYSSLVNQRDLIGMRVFDMLDKEPEKNIRQLENQIVITTLLLKKVENLLEKNNIDKNEILNNKYISL